MNLKDSTRFTRNDLLDVVLDVVDDDVFVVVVLAVVVDILNVVAQKMIFLMSKK